MHGGIDTNSARQVLEKHKGALQPGCHMLLMQGQVGRDQCVEGLTWRAHSRCHRRVHSCPGARLTAHRTAGIKQHVLD